MRPERPEDYEGHVIVFVHEGSGERQTAKVGKVVKLEDHELIFYENDRSHSAYRAVNTLTILDIK